MISKKAQAIASLMVSGIFAVVGGGMLVLTYLGTSADVNHNPFGYIDSCSFESNQTVIRGWGYDADAPTSSNPLVTLFLSTTPGNSYTVATDVSGYRDAQVNNFINTYYPGTPTGSIYGFELHFAALNKNQAITISGTVNNVGEGSPQALAVNSSGPVDGDGSKGYFPNDQIPASCLGGSSTTPQPTPPPPAPNPTPPKPSPTPPSPSPSPSSPTPSPSTPTPTPSGASPTPPPAKPVPAPTSPAPAPKITLPALPSAGATAASVGSGSTSLAIIVPALGASQVQLKYGLSQDSFSDSTSSQTPKDGNATFTLTGLLPGRTYYYEPQLIQADGSIKKGQSGTFTTTGYTVTLYFTNKDGTAARNVSVTAPKLDKDTISTETGAISYYDIKTGSYPITYRYNEKDYSATITVPDPVDPSKNGTSLTKIVIDPQNALIGKLPKSLSLLWLVLIIPFFVVMIMVIRGFHRKRKEREEYRRYGVPLARPVGEPSIAVPPSYVPPLPGSQPLVAPTAPVEPYQALTPYPQTYDQLYSPYPQLTPQPPTPVPPVQPVMRQPAMPPQPSALPQPLDYPTSQYHAAGPYTPPPQYHPKPSKNMKPAPSHYGQSLREMVLQNMPQEPAEPEIPYETYTPPTPTYPTPTYTPPPEQPLPNIPLPPQNPYQ